MNRITQNMRFRLSVVFSYHRVGAAKTAIRYKTTRPFVYFWGHRYNGDIHSLADLSHRPHLHPKQHRDQERKWIQDLRRRNPDMGLVDFWLRLKQLHAYSRSLSSLYRVMRKLSMSPAKTNRPKRKNTPYHTPQYPALKYK